MTDCPHGMPTPASCLDCMDEGNLPPAPIEREERDYDFPAQHPGDCPSCHLPINVGQRIVKTTLGRYLHDDCLPT